MPDLDLGSNEVKAQLERNLETLLTQCSHQYTKGFSMVTPVPDAISRHWTTQLRLFDTSSAQRMTQAFLTALDDAKSPEESNQMVMGEALAQQKRLSNIRTYSEAQYQTWMELMNRPDYPHYLFISERSDTTCDNCRCRHGILYEKASLAEILPPLHPNCLCILIALDSQMVVQYRHRPEFFLDILEETALSVSNGVGGVFYLDHSAMVSGIDESTLIRISQDASLQIVHSMDGIAQMAEDFDGFLHTAKRDLTEFLADAGAAIMGTGAHIGNRFLAGVKLWEKNPLLSIAYMADAMTLTVISGTWDGIVSRFHEMTQTPTAYSIFNFFTLGIVEMLDDTFTPDDPWSFEHWMNILGTATLIVGAVKFGMKATLGADDLIDDVGRTSIDDIADDVGRASADDSLLDDVITETDQGVLDDIVGDVIGTTMPIHTAETQASIVKKLSSYLLDETHPSGGSKAKWFREALGFTQDNLDDLAKQIIFDETQAIPTVSSAYGQKFNQSIATVGANGRQIDVVFGWIQNPDGVVRLTTAIPTKK